MHRRRGYGAPHSNIPAILRLRYEAWNVLLLTGRLSDSASAELPISPKTVMKCIAVCHQNCLLRLLPPFITSAPPTPRRFNHSHSFIHPLPSTMRASAVLLLLPPAAVHSLHVVLPSRAASRATSVVPRSTPAFAVDRRTCRAAGPRAALGLGAKKKSAAEEVLDELVNGTDDEEVEAAVAIAVADEVAEAVVAGDAAAEDAEEGEEEPEELSEEALHDREMMRQAIFMATSSGGERGSHGPFPRPICGAVLVAKDGRVSLSGRLADVLLEKRMCCLFWGRRGIAGYEL